jgi:hypothetical protein
MDSSESSESDLELGAIAEEIASRERAPRKFLNRKFDEDTDDITYRQQHRVPKSVIDFLEEKLSILLTHPTKRNRPFSSREQVN